MSEIAIDLQLPSYDITISNPASTLSVAIEDIASSVESYATQSPPVGAVAANIQVTPVGYITSDNLQSALAEIGKKTYSTSVVPTFIEKGTTWYDTANNQYYVYREIGPGVLQWVPIMVGNDSEDSDTVDAGAF